MVQSVELERRFLCDIKVCLKWISPGGNLSDHWVFIRLGGGGGRKSCIVMKKLRTFEMFQIAFSASIAHVITMPSEI